MRLSLKMKSALFVGLSVLLLVVGVGTWRERQMRLDYVKSFQEQQKLLADTKAEGVADSIELLRGIVEATGLGFDEATFADSDAQRRFFERVANTKAIFSGFSIITAEGSVVASEPARSASAPLSVADRDYFKQVLATGRAVISEPVVSRTSNQPAVIVAAPLRNAQGRLVGVFAAGIQLLRLNVLSQISRDGTGFGGFFALTTRGDHAVYLVHPDASKTLRPVDASEVDSASGDDLLRISNSTNIAIRTRSAVRLTNWDLNALLTSGEAFSAVQLASQRLLASYFYLGTAAGLLAWVSTALLLRPLSRLNDAVEAARVSASGELRTTVIHRDEIGDLTLSFGRLLAQLRTQQAELNAAQDASPLGLFRCGVDGNVIYANDACRDILGLDRKQSLDDWLAMVPADLRERISSDWRRGASSAAPYGGLLRLRRSDGSTLRVSVKTAPIIVGGLHVGNACTLEDVTERERNAKAQRMLLAVFDATPDFVVQNDFQSRMIYMNPAARRMAGVTADEDVSQRVVADFVPAWVVDRMLSEIVPSAMTSGLWVGETAVLDSGGSEVPVNHLLIVHRDSRGKVDRVSSIMRDISANKIAAKALLESQDRLRQVTDNLPALISYLDTDLRFRFANRVYQDWFGFDTDALIGRSLLEVYGERVFSIARPHMAAALAGQRISYEREASTAGGSRSLFVEVTPQFDAQNTVVGLYVLMSDITPRRRAEQALRQSEQRLRSITDRLPMRIAFVDTDERYRFANPAAALALGTTVDEMVGRSVEGLFNSDHYLQLKPHIRRALAGETVSFEFESTEAEAYRCYRATYVPQRSFDGATISGFISIIGEVTSQKLSERRLVEMSRIDSLTGLSNRSGFEAELAESIHVAAMSKVPMALMYLDIDHFKSVNDSFGHLTGDLLLKAFAGRLTKTLRGTDIVTRLGGDEFTIILPGLAQEDDAAKLAANLVLIMQPPFVLDARAINVTVSIGVVVYMGKEVTAAEQLIERADALLYEAKAQGRDGFRLGIV